VKLLFCNIACMKYYKGKIPGIDIPVHGGDYVKKFQDAAEKYNFMPRYLDDEEICLGYVETKSTNRIDANQLHIEKIADIGGNHDVINDVLVIWCAKQVGYDNRTVVVGWYRNAQVYRYWNVAEFADKNGEPVEHYYHVRSKVENCVLLPETERNRFQWNVHRKTAKGPAFGFGQANVWYGDEKARDYIAKLIETISSYEGANWLRKDPFECEKEIWTGKARKNKQPKRSKHSRRSMY